MEDSNNIHEDNTHIDSGTDAESLPAEEKIGTISDVDIPEESVDIAEEMGKIGKNIDPEHPKPLGE